MSDEEELLRISTRILTLLLDVDQTERITIKHLRLLQLITAHYEHNGEAGICTPAELIEQTGWPPSTVSRLLADLAGHGHDRHPAFITLTELPDNRRSKHIRLTDAAAVCKQRVIDGLREALGAPVESKVGD